MRVATHCTCESHSTFALINWFRCLHKKSTWNTLLGGGPLLPFRWEDVPGAKVLLIFGTDWESCPNFVPILFLLSILCFSKAILIHRPSEYNRKSAAHDAAVIVRLRIIIVTYQFLLCQPLHYLYIIPFRWYPFSRVYWFGHRLYLLLERA